MDVMKDSIWFTDEAKAAIHTLSGNIRYFIQILCKNCGYYAVENKRKYIGYPELKHVVDILVGKDAPAVGSMVLNLPENHAAQRKGVKDAVGKKRHGELVWKSLCAFGASIGSKRTIKSYPMPSVSFLKRRFFSNTPMKGNKSIPWR